jgi:ATP/ADP translocase/HEAT repeat protein
MTALLRRIFNVQPGEGISVLLLLLFIFFVHLVYAIGKVLQYSVFLDSYGQKEMAWAYMVAPATLVLVAAAYSGITRFIRPSLLVSGTFAVLAGGFTLWRLLLGSSRPDFPALDVWTPPTVPFGIGPFVLFVWSEVAFSLAIVNAWAIVSDAFDPRQAKRLIPLVGLGASLSFLCSALVRPLVSAGLDAEDLTWVVVGSFVLAILLHEVIQHRGLVRDPARKGPAKPADAQAAGFFGAIRQGFTQVATIPLLRIFAVITVITMLAEALLDFVFWNELRHHFRKNEIAGFYATFTGILGAVQIFLQMFVSGRMLTLLGSTVCLALTPLAVTLGGTVFVILPAFWLLIGLKFGDRVMKQSLYSPSLQALYTPIPSVAKRQAQTLIKGVLSPAAVAMVGGIILVAGSYLGRRGIMAMTVVVTALSATLLLWKLRPAYADALSKALERRKFDPSDLLEDFTVAVDSETLAFIHRTVFEESDESKAVFAIRLLTDARSPQVLALLLKACEHPSARVRREALDLLAEQGRPGDTAFLAERLGRETEPDVIVELLVTLAALGSEGVPGAVTGLLDDPRPAVRAAAALAALRLRLDPGAAEAAVAALTTSATAADRIALAGALERFAAPDLHPVCRPLLADAAPEVRRAGLRAAAALGSAELLPDILACFVSRGPWDEAATALAALGDVAVPELTRLVRDPALPLTLRERVPRILVGVDTDRAGQILEELLADPSETIREQALRSLTRITLQPGGYDHPPRALILARLRDEVLLGLELQSVRRGLGLEADPDQTSLLHQELGHRYTRCLGRVFGLCALVEPPKMAGIIQWNIQSGEPRLAAHAIELMDTAFSREVACLVVPLVERQSRPVDLDRLFPDESERLRRAHREPVLTTLTGRDEWLRLCAAVGWPDQAAAVDPALREEVQRMLPVIEQILFLQSVPIFRELSGEELHFIANITEQMSVAQGEEIFHAGDPGDAMYIVLQGWVAIRLRGGELARLGNRECFGEMAVLDNLPRSADAVAVEDTELLRIDAQSFDELLQEKHQIVKGIFKVLSARLRQSAERRATDKGIPTVASPA